MTRRAALPVVLLFALACKEASQPVAPEPNEPQAPAPSAELLAAYQHASVAAIQYYLSSNGTFELRYGDRVSYSGTFNGSETLISFDFATGVPHSWCKEAWCTTWLAMGRLRGDTLRVEYDRATSWLLCNDMDTGICDNRRAQYVRVAK